MCYNTLMDPEIRKETQDLEIKRDVPKASAPTPRERFAGVYPDADPRKFNSHTTDQEIAEYVNADHTQKISNEQSADKEHIHAAREEETPEEKVYPELKKSPLLLQIIFTIAALLFVNLPAIMFALAFVANLMLLPNDKLLAKEYKVLGFNPLRTLLIIDAFMAIFALIWLIKDLIASII